jgi:hypothetical protein
VRSRRASGTSACRWPAGVHGNTRQSLMPTSYRQDRFLHVPLSEPVSEIASRNSLLLDEISLWLLQPPWPRPETLYKLHVDPAPGRPDPRRSQPPRTRGDTRSTTRVLIWTEQLRGPPGFREHTHLSGPASHRHGRCKMCSDDSGLYKWARLSGLSAAQHSSSARPPPRALRRPPRDGRITRSSDSTSA